MAQVPLSTLAPTHPWTAPKLTDLLYVNNAAGTEEYVGTLGQIRYWINVKDKEAKGDGVTDDTAAIQAALDEAEALGGAVVFFPFGVYLISGVIYDPVSSIPIHIMGEVAAVGAISTFGSVIKLSAPGIALTIGRAATTSAGAVRISNLAFNGANLANSTAIKIFRTNFNLFENVAINLFDGANSIGVEIDGTGDASITNTFFHCKMRACTTAIKATAFTALNIISGFYHNGAIGIDAISGDTLCCLGVNFDAYTTAAVQSDVVGTRIIGGRFEGNERCVIVKGGGDRNIICANFMIGNAGTSGGVEILSGATEGVLVGNVYSNMGSGGKVTNAGTQMTILDETQFRWDPTTNRIVAGRQFEGSIQAVSSGGHAFLGLTGLGGNEWRHRSRSDGWADVRNETGAVVALTYAPLGFPITRGFTLAGLPSNVASYAGGFVYISDDPSVSFSDGASWRQLAERGRVAAINSQADNYTLVLTDRGKVIQCTKASAGIVTVPPNSSVAFPIGTVVHVLQHNEGQISIAQGAGVTVRTPATLNMRAQYSMATLLKIGTDEWTLSGDLEAI